MAREFIFGDRFNSVPRDLLDKLSAILASMDLSSITGVEKGNQIFKGKPGDRHISSGDIRRFYRFANLPQGFDISDLNIFRNVLKNLAPRKTTEDSEKSARTTVPSDGGDPRFGTASSGFLSGDQRGFLSGLQNNPFLPNGDLSFKSVRQSFRNESNARAKEALRQFLISARKGGHDDVSRQGF